MKISQKIGLLGKTKYKIHVIIGRKKPKCRYFKIDKNISKLIAIKYIITTA
jgi:hypothetical protein